MFRELIPLLTMRVFPAREKKTTHFMCDEDHVMTMMSRDLSTEKSIVRWMCNATV